MRRLSALLLCLLTSTAAVAASPQEVQMADTIRRLEEQMKIMQAELAALKAQQAETKAQAETATQAVQKSATGQRRI